MLYGHWECTHQFTGMQVLAKATEAQGVLVTAGEGGCSYAFHSSKGSKEVYKGFIPILTVDVVETTGAGDAFLAGFLFGLVNVCLLPVQFIWVLLESF